MKNKKVVAETTTSQLQLDNDLTIIKFTTNSAKFQYDCSFCLLSYQDCKTRFNGSRACPKYFGQMRKLADGLRSDTACYFNNLGGYKS